MPWSKSIVNIHIYVLLELTVALTILSEGEFTASSNSDAGKKRKQFREIFFHKAKNKIN